MSEYVIIINEQNIDRVKAIFKLYNIEYREAGFPNGKVEVRESFPSKINLHSSMSEYAKQKGYKSVTEAICKMGGGRVFKKNFEKEFKKL